MKRLICVILSVVFIAALIPTAVAASSLTGDVNGDGKVTSNDALTVLNYSVGNSDTINKTKADINKDGTINSADALEILRICVGAAPAFDIPTTKSEIITLYKNTLKTTYNKSSLTVKYTYTESGVTSDLTDKKDTPYNDKTSKTQTFKNGICNGLKITSTHPGYDFSASGVQSASITGGSDGYYIIKLTLKPEQTNVDKLPDINNKAAFGFILSDSSTGTTTYSGTILELKLDSNGNAISLNLHEPYVSEYTVEGKKTHSMKDTGTIDYTATYTF